MAKARARTATRKVKDRWRAKNWYQILAPSLFDNAPVAETLSDNTHNLIGRVIEVSLQDLTNDFRKSHIKLFFKIDKVQDGNAYTNFKGHTLTSDYIRRMIRRRKAHIGGVYEIDTRDGAYIRVKPFAIAEKRIQNSQKKLIRNVMRETISNEGKTKTLNEFLRDTLEGKIGSQIYKNCKNLYPVKRVEIHKTEIQRLPTIKVEEKKPPKKEEVEEPKEIEKEIKREKAKKATVKKEKDTAEEKPKIKREKKIKKPAKKKEVKLKAKSKSTKKKKKTAVVKKKKESK